MDERRYTVAEVANAADLVPETVEDWTRRQIIPVEDAGRNPTYSGFEALRFAATRSLIGHMLTVHRAAEIVSKIPNIDLRGALQVYWTHGKHNHAFVFVTSKRDQPGEYTVFFDNYPKCAEQLASRIEMFNQESNPDPDATSPLLDHNRTAVFDIGPDLDRAVESLGLMQLFSL